MARIAGVNIPNSKRIDIGLTAIYGIGRKKAAYVCKLTGINPSRRVYALTEVEISTLRECIDNNYRVEGELRRYVEMNIKRLLDLGCYRGLRHRRRLPTRGQNTHSNARTRKGKAIPIAAKKK